MDKEHAGKVNTFYETTFILNPVVDLQEVKTLKSRYESIITTHGGVVMHAEEWGLKKLAYPIKKKESGFYIFIEFSGGSSVVHKLEREFSIDENVLRYLTVRLDKYALLYSRRRKDRLRQSGSEQKKESGQSGPEKERKP